MACRSRSRSSSRGAIRTRTAASGAEAEAKAAAAEIIKHLLHSLPRSWQPGEPYILWTDFRSPKPDTYKGRTLSLNAENLQKKNCTFNAAPLQMIHILDPPKQLVDLSNAVHVLASPAPNMPDGQKVHDTIHRLHNEARWLLPLDVEQPPAISDCPDILSEGMHGGEGTTHGLLGFPNQGEGR